MRKRSSSFFAGLSLICIGLCTCFAASAQAQKKAPTNKKDTAGKVPITIVNNKTMEATTTDGTTLFRFVGDVIFQHGADLLYCDTAFLNREKNNLEAFGNVKIVQKDNTTILSDYLSYSGGIKKAYLRGNVSLTSGEDQLWTEEMDYFLTEKVGNYYQSGTLQTGSTTVSSNLGTYNSGTKEARFKENVIVTDTAYNIESKDLGYNTESKTMRFFDSTTVYDESSVLRTANGTYDSKLQIAHFVTRSSVLNEEQYIIGDSLDYNKQTGLGRASGNVVILDTAQRAVLFCGKTFYNEKLKTLLAVEKPVLKKMSDKDSMFVRADSFYSAHLVRYKDSAAGTNKAAAPLKKSGKKPRIASAVPDSMMPVSVVQNPVFLPDTTSPKYYSGFPHVRIFSDSTQGRCDSVCFTGKDSLIIMMRQPVLWSRNSQITGDTIFAFIVNGQIDKMVVPNDALIVSRTGPESAEIFNQIQGRRLVVYMKDEAPDYAIIRPDAECIYYPTDEEGAYLGVSKSKAERMKVFFKSGEIARIVQIQEPEGTLSPLNKVNLPTMRLSRFIWREKERPRSVAELFE